MRFDGRAHAGGGAAAQAGDDIMRRYTTDGFGRRDIGLLLISAVSWAALLGGIQARAAGVLRPIGVPAESVQIREHFVNVLINNGYARTEVIQTFYNPNEIDLEAIYAFPVPQHACLSELTIYAGEQEIHGEVLPKDVAERIYGEEKARGSDAGLAKKADYETYEFYVTPVRAQSLTRLRFLYYEPVTIDTGVGRYVYPLEHGQTNDYGRHFWLMTDEQVDDLFSVQIDIDYAWPISDVRVPGFEAATVVEPLDEGRCRVLVETQGTNLNRDLVLYFRLADDLPGRVELIPYRAAEDEPGTFMLVVTPGIDLQPLAGGADYVFVLDISGSMKGRLETLAAGVVRVLGEMQPGDRFRVVAFSGDAFELTQSWTPAGTEEVEYVIERVLDLSPDGGTNLYAGLELGLTGLSAKRATSVILVTDAATNAGIIEPRAFHELLRAYDVRLFGFLLGNNANWPLMKLLAESSGGFYASVSNADDILGQVMLAKSKVLHECLHDVELTVEGVDVFDVTSGAFGKVYRGQQLVLIGRYAEPGTAQVSLWASVTGEDRQYSTIVDFPALALDHPELERLWAMDVIEDIETQRQLGFMPEDDARLAIEDLAVEFQLVTDETSMVALPDEVFAEYGIERRNAARVAVEQEGETQRLARPARSYRVDQAEPMFSEPAPRLNNGGGNGGGAVDPVTGVLVVLLAAAGLVQMHRGRRWAQ